MNQKDVFDFRKKHNLEQKDLADIIGVTWQAVRFWEIIDPPGCKKPQNRPVPNYAVKIMGMIDLYPQLKEQFKKL